jgi:O-antigen ligase
MHPDAFAGQLGKDRTLTGRTDLWAVAISMIEHRPWLGYGYSAFWRDGAPGPAAAFWAAVGWRTPHSHNGFIDLTLDLGLLGLLLFLTGLVTATIKAFGRARTGSTIGAVGPLVFLAYTVLYNLSESSLFKHNTLFWVVYVIGIAGAYGASPREPSIVTGAAGSRRAPPWGHRAR